MNDGREPVGLVMLKVFSGKEVKSPRGSLRSFRVSSPVLAMVVVTFKFSNPSTSTSGVQVQTVKPGVAETAMAEAVRVMMEAGGSGGHCEGVRGDNGNELNEPRLKSLPASGVIGEQWLSDRHRGSVPLQVHEQEIV